MRLFEHVSILGGWRSRSHVTSSSFSPVRHLAQRARHVRSASLFDDIPSITTDGQAGKLARSHAALETVCHCAAFLRKQLSLFRTFSHCLRRLGRVAHPELVRTNSPRMPAVDAHQLWMHLHRRGRSTFDTFAPSSHQLQIHPGRHLDHPLVGRSPSASSSSKRSIFCICQRGKRNDEPLSLTTQPMEHSFARTPK